MHQITRYLKAAACSTESTKQTDHLKAFVLVFWYAPLLSLALFSALRDSNTHPGCMDPTIGNSQLNSIEAPEKLYTAITRLSAAFRVFSAPKETKQSATAKHQTML